MPQRRGRLVHRFMIHVAVDSRLGSAMVEFIVNGPLELGRSRVNRLGQRKSVVTDDNRLQAVHVRLHPAAHVASAHGMRSVPAEANFHEDDPITKTIQGSRDNAFNSMRQFLATVNVLVGVDPNLHLKSASFTKTGKANVAKNMPHGYPPFD
jgi:hypothetical protein